MNQLSIERINEYAPYKVEVEDGQYIFETDNYILYGVSFDEDPMPELARKTVESVLREYGIIAGKDFQLEVLKRKTPTGIFDLV